MDFVDEKYSWHDILEMFGGFKYFSKDHLLCLYHRVNNREEQAKIYQTIIDEEAEQVRQALLKMCTAQEIEAASKAGVEEVIEPISDQEI